MQQRPTAAELLADISSLLTQVIDVVPDPQKHQVRVAANLAGIVEREVTLGPANDDAERARLADLLELPADTDVMVSFIAPTGGSPAGTGTVTVWVDWAS